MRDVLVIHYGGMADVDLQLTPEQIEVVETEILDFFAVTRMRSRPSLALTRYGKWSAEDSDRIFAEINRRHRQTIVDSFIDPEASLLDI